jgi:hypothetical protein
LIFVLERIRVGAELEETHTAAAIQVMVHPPTALMLEQLVLGGAIALFPVR